MQEKFYYDVPFGTRNGEPNAVPAQLVIAHTERIDYVLNFLQSDLGIAVMAIPRDPRPLIEWSQEKRLAFFEEAERGFTQIGFSPERGFRELLLNQGSLVGQTIPHPHLHLFVGRDNFLLNWGREALPEELLVLHFTGKVLAGQYNLYQKGTEEWQLIPRPDLNSKHNPKREDTYPIFMDGKLLPEWEKKVEALRYAYNFYM